MTPSHGPPRGGQELTASSPRPLRMICAHASDEMYGSDRVLLNILERLPRDVECLVVLPTDVPGPGPLSQALRARGIRVVRMPLAVIRRKYLTPLGVAAYAVRFAYSTLALARLIRRERPDLAYTHTSVVLPLAVASRLARVRHVWHVLEIIVKPAMLGRAVACLVARFAARIVAASEAVRSSIVAYCPLALPFTVVIRNGVDVTRFAPRGDTSTTRAGLGVKPGSILIGMVGRVGTWKGQELLLQAAARLARNNPQVQFVLIGGAVERNRHPLDWLRSGIDAGGLGGRVVVSDFRADIPEVLAALDIFVLPSILPDPYPTTLLEAMATGLAVVACAHGGAVEMVTDGETGLLFRPGDVADLTDKLNQLCNDLELRRRLGHAARERAMEEFDLARFGRQFHELFLDVASEGGLA